MNEIPLSTWLRAMAAQADLHCLRGRTTVRLSEWRALADALYDAADQASALERRIADHARQELRRVCRRGGAA